MDGEVLKILDSYSVEIDIKKGKKIVKIPSLGKSGFIKDDILENQKSLLLGNVWGSGTLTLRQSEDSDNEIWMEDFKPMQTAIVELDYFIEQRKQFSLEQWREMLVMSMGYNPELYSPKQQLWLITRLIPLIQPRVNLIELAPKGTGKSFVFSQLSRYAWLISGGIVTRAKLFYDMTSKNYGVITQYDTVILDEVQTINFREPEEIIGALKRYLENGEFRVMNVSATSEASFVMLANIIMGNDGRPLHENYFNFLPKFLQETAFIDRIHGLLPGWELPRIEKQMIGNGLALKADYFSSILHGFRARTEFSTYFRENVMADGDLRDINAVERLCSGYLKLLFPDLGTINEEQFMEYCLNPAKQLRSIIREQLSIRDHEYKNVLARIEVR
jgi:ATP-dependent Lon protease